MTTLRTICVATDLSPRANEAIAQADRWALAHGADLVIIHVVPDLVGLHLLFPARVAEEEADQLALIERARVAVLTRVQEVTGRAPEDFDVEIHVGGADTEIVGAAQDAGADVLVLGDSGIGGLARSLFGRTVTKVLRAAELPVLIARRSAATNVTLAATDFSDPAKPALRAGHARARVAGGPLTFLHSVDFVPAPAYARAAIGVGAATIYPTRDVLDAATGRLREAAMEIGASPVELLVGVGGAAHEIVLAAEKIRADLVVVGTHGRTGFARLVLGSVAESVARHAPCSVLVVPLAAQ